MWFQHGEEFYEHKSNEKINQLSYIKNENSSLKNINKNKRLMKKTEESICTH